MVIVTVTLAVVYWCRTHYFFAKRIIWWKLDIGHIHAYWTPWKWRTMLTAQMCVIQTAYTFILYNYKTLVLALYCFMVNHMGSAWSWFRVSRHEWWIGSLINYQLYLYSFYYHCSGLVNSWILRENHHASVVWNWYNWVAIAYLYQPSP